MSDVATHETSIGIGILAEHAKKVVNFATIKLSLASEERYTQAIFGLELQSHLHQMGLQWLSCSGRFENATDHCLYLQNARNLAIDLNEALSDAEPFVRQKHEEAFETGPEYFFTDSSTSSKDHERIAFLDCVRQGKIFPLVLGLDRISTQWNGKWRPMSLERATELKQFAKVVFGDLSLPFTEMALTSLLIRFQFAPDLDTCKLIRIVFGLDGSTEIQNCRGCQPAFMALDYMDDDGAMKIHVPLAQAGKDRRCLDEHDYGRTFETEAGVVCSSLVQLSSSYQGWSYLPMYHQNDPVSSPAEEESDEWDPDGFDEQDRHFQPYPPDSEVRLCFIKPGHNIARREDNEDEDEPEQEDGGED